MNCKHCGSSNTKYIGMMPFSTVSSYLCSSCNKSFTAKKIYQSDKKQSKNSFVTGIPDEKLMWCVGCGKKMCWYLGFHIDIRCANKECKYYTKYDGNGNKKQNGKDLLGWSED